MTLTSTDNVGQCGRSCLNRPHKCLGWSLMVNLAPYPGFICDGRYVFVFNWTPALDSCSSTTPPHGLIFSAFMNPGCIPLGFVSAVRSLRSARTEGVRVKDACARHSLGSVFRMACMCGSSIFNLLDASISPIKATLCLQKPRCHIAVCKLFSHAATPCSGLSPSVNILLSQLFFLCEFGVLQVLWPVCLAAAVSLGAVAASLYTTYSNLVKILVRWQTSQSCVKN